jgi:hypothetical protein
MTVSKDKVKEPSLAWGMARGVDLSLIEANLRKTPAERIRAHSRALAAAEKLKKGVLRVISEST